LDAVGSRFLTPRVLRKLEAALVVILDAVLVLKLFKGGLQIRRV
jgi:hypothetical protein